MGSVLGVGNVIIPLSRSRSNFGGFVTRRCRVDVGKVDFGAIYVVVGAGFSLVVSPSVRWIREKDGQFSLRSS